MKKQKKDTDISSNRAAEVRRFMKLAKDMPDIRQEKVAAIKKQIESGTYNVSAESVAERVVDLYSSLNSGK